MSEFDDFIQEAADEVGVPARNSKKKKKLIYWGGKAAGTPAVPVWAAALARVKAGSGRAKLAVLGDSTSSGWMSGGASPNNDRPFAMANLLATKLAAAGYASTIGNLFGDTGSNIGGTTLLYDARVTMGAGWTIPPAGGVVVGGAKFNSSTNANKWSIAIAASIDTIEAWFATNPAYGAIDIGIDGGAVIGAPVNLGVALSVLKATRAAALGVHTVDFFKDVAGDALNVSLLGLNCFNSAIPAVDCFNWGYSGSNVTDWATIGAPTNPVNAIPVFAPDLTIINLTINDASGGTTVNTYKTKLQQIVTACKLTGDVIIMTGTQINTGANAYEGTLVQAAQEIAALNRVRFVNMYNLMGTWASMNSSGYITDTTHPNALGYQAIADLLFPRILP